MPGLVGASDRGRHPRFTGKEIETQVTRLTGNSVLALILGLNAACSPLT